jgi:cytosine/uracil/thiamine/allantoin permease
MARLLAVLVGLVVSGLALWLLDTMGIVPPMPSARDKQTMADLGLVGWVFGAVYVAWVAAIGAVAVGCGYLGYRAVATVFADG